MKFRVRSGHKKRFGLGKIFAAAAALEVAAVSVMSYAAQGGDLKVLATAAGTGLASLFGAAASGAVLGLGAAGLVHLSNRKKGVDGLADTASVGMVGGIAGTVGFIAGAIATPMLLLS